MGLDEAAPKNVRLRVYRLASLAVLFNADRSKKLYILRMADTMMPAPHTENAGGGSESSVLAVSITDIKCACRSADAHNCRVLRYHGHTGVSEFTVNNEGSPCECACHEIEYHDDWDAPIVHRGTEA